MRAGSLRHLVEIQRPINTKDAVGDVTTSYSTVASAWAAIQPLNTRDQLLAAQSRSSITHKIRLRHDLAILGMDGSWRIKFGSRIYSVEGYPRNIDERNIYFEILCTEGLLFTDESVTQPPTPFSTVTQLGLMALSRGIRAPVSNGQFQSSTLSNAITQLSLIGLSKGA